MGLEADTRRTAERQQTLPIPNDIAVPTTGIIKDSDAKLLTALKALGYDTSNPDKAIRDFQKVNGLKEDGNAGKNTITKLNEELERSRIKVAITPPSLDIGRPETIPEVAITSPEIGQPRLLEEETVPSQQIAELPKDQREEVLNSVQDEVKQYDSKGLEKTIEDLNPFDSSLSKRMENIQKIEDQLTQLNSEIDQARASGDAKKEQNLLSKKEKLTDDYNNKFTDLNYKINVATIKSQKEQDVQELRTNIKNAESKEEQTRLKKQLKEVQEGYKISEKIVKLNRDIEKAKNSRDEKKLTRLENEKSQLEDDLAKIQDNLALSQIEIPLPEDTKLAPEELILETAKLPIHVPDYMPDEEQEISGYVIPDIPEDLSNKFMPPEIPELKALEVSVGHDMQLIDSYQPESQRLNIEYSDEDIQTLAIADTLYKSGLTKTSELSYLDELMKGINTGNIKLNQDTKKRISSAKSDPEVSKFAAIAKEINAGSKIVFSGNSITVKNPKISTASEYIFNSERINLLKEARIASLANQFAETGISQSTRLELREQGLTDAEINQADSLAKRTKKVIKQPKQTVTARSEDEFRDLVIAGAWGQLGLPVDFDVGINTCIDVVVRAMRRAGISLPGGVNPRLCSSVGPWMQTEGATPKSEKAAKKGDIIFFTGTDKDTHIRKTWFHSAVVLDKYPDGRIKSAIMSSGLDGLVPDPKHPGKLITSPRLIEEVKIINYQPWVEARRLSHHMDVKAIYSPYDLVKNQIKNQNNVATR